MPSFCRHNRLVQNCSICSREQAVEMRPVVSSSAPKVSQPGASRTSGGAGERNASAGPGARHGSARLGTKGLRGAQARGLTVRRLARGVDDGYHCILVPGLKSSSDAGRLATELAFAQRRLELLAAQPPGLWGEVAGDGELEERLWLAFLIALIGPESGEDELADPFAQISAVRVPWGELPDLSEVRGGPRGALTAKGGAGAAQAYVTWAARAGSQAVALSGDAAWALDRRFARAFERLGTLRGLSRDARFEFLTGLAATGVLELRAGSLQFGGDNETTVAAKRIFGIGDHLLLERRAAEFATAAGLELAALDLGLHNWGTGRRDRGGVDAELEPDRETVERIGVALGL